MAEFIGLGGTNEVGASAYLYRLAEGNLLIDAGLRPGLIGKAALPGLELLEEEANHPTCMVLTHAHLDHVGALPLVVRRFPKLKIYCTYPTARLAEKVLADTLKIGRNNGEALFDAHAMNRALNRLTVVEPHQVIAEHGFGLMLVPAGHLLGACSVAIQSEEGKFFHTADFSNVSGYTTDAAFVPPRPIEQDVVVMEATYGDQMLPSRKEQVARFTRAVGSVLSGVGKVLIPSFALGRAQDMLMLLLLEMDAGRLPKVPIYLDGMVREVTELYEELLDYLPEQVKNRASNNKKPPFLAEQVHLVNSPKERQSAIEEQGPSIIITSSGMLQAGPSPIYARALLPEPRNALFIVGYQDAESPGRRLLELENGGEVTLPDGEGTVQVPAYCRIERFYLSAHADRGGLISLLGNFPAKKVILMHGEGSARHALAEHLRKKHEVHLARNGEVVNLLERTPHLMTKPLPMPGRATREQLELQAQVDEESQAIPQKIRTLTLQVEAKFDPQTRQLVLTFPMDVDPALFPEGTYHLQAVRQNVTRMSLKQQWTQHKTVQGLTEEDRKLIESTGPYPATFRDIAQRGFSDQREQALKWANQMVDAGILKRSGAGKYDLAPTPEQSTPEAEKAPS